MTRINRALWMTAALGAAFLAGCGSSITDMDAGSGSCTSDANCGTGKGCHPVLKQCVTTCTGSSDCPASEKTCAKIGDSASSFCQCSTDALCNSAVAGNICSTATKACTAKCTGNTDCPTGYTCNTTSGQCTGGATGDAGTDAGMTTDAGVTCNNANQPDICGYGAVCSADNLCEQLGDDRTCGNISSSNRPAWTSASTGPVIYRVDDVAADDASACTAGTTPFTTIVYAYAPTGSTFPAMKSGLPGFFYYSTSGNATDIPANLLTSANYTLYANGTVMSAKFTLCSGTATTSLVAGFGFTNGNSVCTTLTH